MNDRSPMVLLIEDNKSDALLIQEMMRDTGIKHRLTWLNDGEKAVRYFEAGNAADIIILDLNLPKFSGHQMMDFFKEQDISSKMPVVILTGSTSPLDLETAKDKGVVSYLIKPMTIEEMKQVTATFKDILLGERSACRRALR